MYHPTRGGTRGGAAEFSWETVKASKDREFYLGNSVAAPTGRWQDGRDINWYNKDASSSQQSGKQADEQRLAELRAIKQAEEEALYAKLGRKPPSATDNGTSLGQHLVTGSASYAPDRSTGANTAPINVGKSRSWKAGTDDDITEEDRILARRLAKEQVKNDIKRQKREEKELVRVSRRHRRMERASKDSRAHDGEQSTGSYHRRDYEDKSRLERRSPQQDGRDGDDQRDHRPSRSAAEVSRVHHHRRHSRSRSRSRSPRRSRFHLGRERQTRPRSRSPSSHHSHRHSHGRERRTER